MHYIVKRNAAQNAAPALVSSPSNFGHMSRATSCSLGLTVPTAMQSPLMKFATFFTAFSLCVITLALGCGQQQEVKSVPQDELEAYMQQHPEAANADEFMSE
jgi:hypothetical protein